MLIRTNSLRLGLMIGASVLTALSAYAGERTQILLRGRQGNVKALAKFMKTQQAGAHLQLAVDALPFVAQLLPLLPHGARHTGNLIQLPNGSDFEVVKAKTVAQMQACTGLNVPMATGKKHQRKSSVVRSSAEIR